jgi:hypothetical protein
MHLTAAQAQALLSEYSMEEVRRMFSEKSELTVTTLYFGNLCAMGDEEKIKSFIQETEPDRLRHILNHCPEEQWYGNCLHMLLFWNTGDKAISLFKLLVDHGAIEYTRNYYNVYPWQINAPSWIVPFGNVVLGNRDIDEFRDTYEAIERLFPLEQYTDSDSDCNEEDPCASCDHQSYEEHILCEHYMRYHEYDPDPYAPRWCTHRGNYTCPRNCICICYNCNP